VGSNQEQGHPGEDGLITNWRVANR